MLVEEGRGEYYLTLMDYQRLRKLSALPLMNLYANHGRVFIPFRLKPEAAADAGCCIGGEPPCGIAPRYVDSNTRFLARLSLQPGECVSIFSSFDYEASQSPLNVFKGTYKFHDESDALVQFVVHQEGIARDAASALKSELPALGFVFGQPGADPAFESAESLGESAIYADHKVGGLPFFSQIEGDVGVSLDLLRDGYVHLLQLNMPSAVSDTLVRVMWPFGESVFHVFARKMENAIQFRYIWA